MMRIVKIILAVIFLICLINMPYGYYMFVRLAGMIGFIYFAYLDKEQKPLLILWIGSAILINPFFKISFGRELWNIVDVIWAVILFLDVIFRNKLKLNSSGKLFRIFNYEISYSKTNKNEDIIRKVESNNNDFRITIKNQIKRIEKIYEDKLEVPIKFTILLLGLIVVIFLFVKLEYDDFLLLMVLLYFTYYIFSFILRVLWNIFKNYILKDDIEQEDLQKFETEINKTNQNQNSNQVIYKHSGIDTASYDNN